MLYLYRTYSYSDLSLKKCLDRGECHERFFLDWFFLYRFYWKRFYRCASRFIRKILWKIGRLFDLMPCQSRLREAPCNSRIDADVIVILDTLEWTIGPFPDTRTRILINVHGNLKSRLYSKDESLFPLKGCR